jgi:Na+/proline symporter
VATVFAVVVAGAAYLVGSTVRLFFDKVPLDAAGAPMFNTLIPQLLSQTMPEYLLIVILLLVLSASMSTLSSLILVSSSAITIDLIQVFIICAIMIAIFKFDFIIKLMALSWGTIAGAFLAPYLYGLFWKGTTKSGAWAGMITGVVLSIGGSLLFTDEKTAPLVSTAAMVIPLIVVPVVSLATKKYHSFHLDKVFKRNEAGKAMVAAAKTE